MSHGDLVNGVYAATGGVLLSIAIASARGNTSRAPGRTALTASLGTLGVSFLVQSPAARGVQNEIVVNLGQLTGNGTTLIAAYALQVMVLHILYERTAALAHARRWRAGLVLALAALTGLFVSTPTAADRFTSPEAPGGIVAYYLIFTGYLGATVTSLYLLISRYATRTPDRWLRMSLRLQQLACVTAMVYFAGRIAALLIGRLGIDMHRDHRFGLVELVVATVIPAVGVALLAAGIVVKASGRWWQYRRTLRRLRPLWEAAREASPDTVLPVARGWGGARLRLYRRVIEIQDAQLAAEQRVGATLRRQIDDAVDSAALTGDTARAVRQAAVFAAGLAALREDRTLADVGGLAVTLADVGGLAVTPADDGGVAVTPADDGGVAVTPAGDNLDLAAVVHRLEHVSDAYVSSPIVGRFATAAAYPARH